MNISYKLIFMYSLFMTTSKYCLEFCYISELLALDQIEYKKKKIRNLFHPATISMSTLELFYNSSISTKSWQNLGNIDGEK